MDSMTDQEPTVKVTDVRAVGTGKAEQSDKESELENGHDSLTM